VGQIGKMVDLERHLCSFERQHRLGRTFHDERG
jgi:hypothetical protein